MRCRLVVPLIAIASCAFASGPHFRRHRIGRLPANSVAGYALDGRVLFTWGNGVQRRSLPSGDPENVARGTFAEGGCLMDVDGDGQLDLIVNQTGEHPELVWFHAPAWTRHVIDTGVDSLDMIPATIFSRRGILLVHKRSQVRFYEPPADPTQRWPETELYSFYTPSDEGGLRIADVDGDGLPDILCGNYWIQSPTEFELPWHLFAIDLWTEVKSSALLRLEWVDLFGTGKANRIAVQRAMPHARLAWSERTADPKQLWTAHALAEDLDLNAPNSLAVADFDGDGRSDILIAERKGKGRLILFRNNGEGHFTPSVLARTDGILAAAAIQMRKSGKPDILVLGKSELSWWEIR